MDFRWNPNFKYGAASYMAIDSYNTAAGVEHVNRS